MIGYIYALDLYLFLCEECLWKDKVSKQEYLNSNTKVLKVSLKAFKSKDIL